MAAVPVLAPAENRKIYFDSNTPKLKILSKESKMPVLEIAQDTVETALAKDFASIPQVRHVMTERVDGPLLVWIVADAPGPQTRDRIYQKELELISGFPEIDFDFNLVPAMGRSAHDIASSARVAYTRSA